MKPNFSDPGVTIAELTAGSFLIKKALSSDDPVAWLKEALRLFDAEIERRHAEETARKAKQEAELTLIRLAEKIGYDEATKFLLKLGEKK